MWTEDHKRSDANHTGCINLIQSVTTNCAKLELMTAQRSYTDTSTARVTAPDLPLWGLFLWQFEKTEWGEFMNPLHSPEERTQ